jgi:hypothetical protein
MVTKSPTAPAPITLSTTTDPRHIQHWSTHEHEHPRGRHRRLPARGLVVSTAAELEKDDKAPPSHDQGNHSKAVR